MKKNVHCKVSGYSIGKKLKEILEQELEKACAPASSSAIISFKDPSYSAEQGGYHPVEVFIKPDGEIMYITDFSYVGMGYDVELAKEIDFDFSEKAFGHFGMDYPIAQGRELFGVWQRNFCDYYRHGVYEVKTEVL